MFLRPSFFGLIASGLLLFVVFVSLVLHYKTIKPVEFIFLCIGLSIAISAHSLLHHVEEIKYDFNPMKMFA